MDCERDATQGDHADRLVVELEVRVATAGGVRRIECCTGELAVNYQISQEKILQKIPLVTCQ